MTQDLLLGALRLGPSQQESVVCRPLDGAICHALVESAVRARLSFQLLDRLQAQNRLGELSSGCVKKLRAQVREAAARNALQAFRVRQILESCAAQGMPVILTKGLWLAEQVYRDAGARDACDIDLLLHATDLPAFMQVARDLGYDVPARADDLASAASTTNEFALWHRASGVLVDVHWSLTNPATELAVDEEALWRRSEIVQVAGTPCRTLGLEDHLLYLCFHAAVHHKFWALGPRCLYDVAMVLRRPPRAIRWDDLVAHARELGWQKAAWLMFALVREHLGAAVPDDVMQALHAQGSEDAEVCRMAIEAIFASRSQDSLYRHLAHLSALPSWRQRAVALGRVLLPSRVQMTNQFGLCEDTSTWRLHLRRWRTKAHALRTTLGGLLLASPSHRAELARTRRIEAWLLASPGSTGRFARAQMRAAIVALFALPVFALLVRCMSLARLLACVEGSAPAQALRLRVDEAAALGRAVNMATGRGPWAARCLTRSLLLHWLLRRRGIASVLRIGVAPGDVFRAHAWVECGGVPVNDRADVATVFTAFDSLSLERGQVRA